MVLMVAILKRSYFVYFIDKILFEPYLDVSIMDDGLLVTQ